MVSVSIWQVKMVFAMFFSSHTFIVYSHHNQWRNEAMRCDAEQNGLIFLHGFSHVSPVFTFQMDTNLEDIHYWSFECRAFVIIIITIPKHPFIFYTIPQRYEKSLKSCQNTNSTRYQKNLCIWHIKYNEALIMGRLIKRKKYWNFVILIVNVCLDKYVLNWRSRMLQGVLQLQFRDFATL